MCETAWRATGLCSRSAVYVNETDSSADDAVLKLSSRLLVFYFLCDYFTVGGLTLAQLQQNCTDWENSQ